MFELVKLLDARSFVFIVFNLGFWSITQLMLLLH